MRKVLLSTIGICMLLLSAQARNNADWREYTGSYVFSGDNLTETLEITLLRDTILTASSSLGEATLTYVEKDRFEFPKYGGVIVFERNEEQQIIACRISVAVIDLDEIIAQKQ
jgi:hypothetical protein